MAPIGCAGVHPALGAARSAQFGERGRREGARVRDQEAGAPDFGHCARDQVGLDEGHGDTVRGQFGAQGRGPVL